MVTLEELQAIPLFESLTEGQLAQLARTLPDIHLRAGEYAVHEGQARALIIPIEGRLEVTKTLDGVERVIGVRAQGELFGEVPMALNTPFLASVRAAEPSRVIRIEPKEYHGLAALAPAISAVLGAAALDRIEGLQDIAAEPPAPALRVFGPRWDAACHALRAFLSNNRVPFDWVTTADGSPATVELPDGRVLVEPSLRDVASAVGLGFKPEHAEYNVVIVGGGPAGLAAAVYGASEGLRTLLVERTAPGGQAGTSSRIENYLGFPFGVSGDELAGRALAQAKRLGAEIIVTRTVEAIEPSSRTLVLDGGERLRARTIILAMGVSWRRLQVEDIDRLHGRGVYYGAARSEASSVQGTDVYLVGAGNSAGQAAMFFADYARSVTLLVRGDSLLKSMSHYLVEQLKTKKNVRAELSSEIAAVHGDERLEAIDVTNRVSGRIDRKDAASIFIFIGADAETGWLPDEIARDPRGYILTGSDARSTGRWHEGRDPYLVETTVPGIFAAGDVRAGSVKRCAAGVGEGSIAIAFVHQYLQ